MEKTGYSVIAGRPAARKFEETHRTAPQVSFATILEVLGAITFAVILLALYGCADPELDHQQQVAERNARFWNACAAMGKQRIVNEWQNGQLVCYAWDKKPGKHQTPAVIASAEDL